MIRITFSDTFTTRFRKDFKNDDEELLADLVVKHAEKLRLIKDRSASMIFVATDIHSEIRRNRQSFP